MKKIFPIFLLLSFLILICIITQIHAILKNKFMLDKEAFSIAKAMKDRRSFITDNINYYTNLYLDKQQGETLKELNNDELTNFIYLDSNNNLVEGYENQIHPTLDKIKQCENITSCSQLDSFPDCGYCGSTKKFVYKYNNNIGPDVCPKKSRPLYDDDGNENTQEVNTWANNSSDCKKIKEQLECDLITECSDMPDHCGFCPSTGKALVATDGANPQIKYRDDPNLDIRGDKCPGLGTTINGNGGNIWFSSLTKASDCTLCDNEKNNNSRTYSDTCMQSLWKSSKVKDGYSAKCVTDWTDIKDNKELSSVSNSKNKDYYKIEKDMKTLVNDKLINFYKDYENRNDRQHDVGVIDNIWKLCFGRNRNDLM